MSTLLLQVYNCFLYHLSECCFCHEGENPELGVFFQDKDMSIAVHQYCLVCIHLYFLNIGWIALFL